MTETAGRVQFVRDGTLALLGPAGDIDGVGGGHPGGPAHRARPGVTGRGPSLGGRGPFSGRRELLAGDVSRTGPAGSRPRAAG